MTIHSGTGNAVRGNSIYDNYDLAINLIAPNDLTSGAMRWVTLNDSAGHAGVNLFQSFPVLSSAAAADSSVLVRGTLHAAASSTYAIDVFASTSPDPSLYGEGQTYLGSFTVTTNSSGNVTFGGNVAMPPGGQYYITATATDSAGNTSEFSAGLSPASGATYRDTTGNGLSADDIPMAGVVVNVYADANGNKALDSGDGTPIASVTSDSSGTYWIALPPGQYFTEEVVPTHYIRTWPASSTYYAANVAAGTSVENLDFANYKTPCSCQQLTDIVYRVNDTPVSDLRGHVEQGDTVSVTFTVPDGSNPMTITLVSYTAPASSFYGNTASQQAIWDQDGGTFGPGTYTISVEIPDSYFQVDFVCGYAIDRFGPADSNIFYTPQGRLISADNGGTQAYIAGSSSLTGFVYADANNNGVLDDGEDGLSGVTLNLSGFDARGNAISRTCRTDSRGRYSFAGLLSGNYQISEAQPAGYDDGILSLGNRGGSIGSGAFAVAISDTAAYAHYNFGEKPKAQSSVSAGDSASPSFWRGSKGQSLIKSFGGSSRSTALANWLASTFPRLWGSGSQNCLVNKTNSDVASLIYSLAYYSSTKADAEVLAAALSVYSTTSSLGGTKAASYGFKITSTGLGAKTWNVGSNGAAFGVSNYTTLTVRQFLDAANAKAFKGVLCNGSSSLCTVTFNVFDAINNKGGI